VVPDGVATSSLDLWTERVPHAGQSLARPRLTFATLPFVAHDDYDRLRGNAMRTSCGAEDSFVRASGGASVRLAHLSAGRRCAPREADEIQPPLRSRSRRRRANALNAFLAPAFNDGDGAASAGRVARLSRGVSGAGRAFGALGQTTRRTPRSGFRTGQKSAGIGYNFRFLRLGPEAPEKRRK